VIIKMKMRMDHWW